MGDEGNIDFWGFCFLLVAILYSLAAVLAPWVLMVVYTKNRRMWLWWYRNGWKGTVAIALLGGIFRVPIFLSRSGIDGPQLFFFPDTALALRLAMPLDPITYDRGPSFAFVVLFLLQLLVLFGLYSLLKFSKTYFAKRAYEIE